MKNIKTLIVIVIVVVACLAVVTGLSFIPEYSSRRAGKNILDAISHTQRVYEQALFTERAKPQETTTAPAAKGPALDMRTLNLLERAENRLSSAIEANPRAEKNAVSLANRTLTTVAASIGRLRLDAATAGETELTKQVKQSDQLASKLRNALNWTKFYQRAASDTNQEVKQMLSLAQSNIESLNEKISSIETALNESKNRLETLQEKNKKLLNQIRELRTQSRLTSGEKSLELFNEAMSLQEEIDRINSEISKIENTRQKQQAVLKDLRTQAASARARADAAQELLAGRQSDIKNLNQQLEKHKQQISDTISKLIEQAEKISSLCSDITNNRAQAIDAYARAAEYAQRSASANTDKAPLLFAEQSQMHQSIASTHKANILLAQKLTSLSKQIDNVAKNSDASLSQPLNTLKNCMPDTEQARTAAESAYKEAIQLNSMAVDAAPAKFKWVYQGALASAYTDLYRLTGDAEARNKAIQARDQALEGKKASPFLEPISQIKP